MLSHVHLAALLSLAAGAAGAAAPAAGQDRRALRPNVEAREFAPVTPAHAEPFEFTLPRPPLDRPRTAALIAGLRDSQTADACLAGLVRLDLSELKRHARDLPAEALRARLLAPATDPDAADACGFLLAFADPQAARAALSRAALDRAKRGDQATGCVLGLLLCGGEPALEWLGKLCVRPRCPIGFTLSALTAADVAVREPGFGLNPARLHGFAATLLASDAAAPSAVDKLIDWRAWQHAAAVLNAAERSADPDALRRRSLQLAAGRFALACASDRSAGTHGRLCQSWLSETAATDPDLLRRARRIAGR